MTYGGQTALQQDDSAEAFDYFNIYVAPGIDTLFGPVLVSDMTSAESLHIVVAEATEADIVTARLAPNGLDTEVIYREEVVAILKDVQRLAPNQVVFAPMSLVDSASGTPLPPEEPATTPDTFVWNGLDRSSLQLKPVLVPHYVPGHDRLEANLGFGPNSPKVRIEDSGDGDTFVRVNGKALFRLQGIAAHQVNRADLQINRL